MIKQDESQVIFDSRFKNIYDETFHGTHQGAETLQKNISENAQEEHCEREIFLACSGKGAEPERDQLAARIFLSVSILFMEKAERKKGCSSCKNQSIYSTQPK